MMPRKIVLKRRKTGKHLSVIFNVVERGKEKPEESGRKIGSSGNRKVTIYTLAPSVIY
jgi:hypothetical protein